MGTPPGDRIPFAYRAVTFCGASFHNASARYRFCNSLGRLLPSLAGPTTPLQHRQQAVPLQRFGLFPFRSPLLRKSRLLSFPRGTEMFQFPRFPPPSLCVQLGVTGHDPCRVSPFGDPRIEAWSAAPRGLSQPPTSFIGIWRQGIHRWLFVAWNLSRCSCSLCSSQGACALKKRLGHGRGDVHATPADPKKERPKPPQGGPGAVPSKRNSDDR